MTSSSPMAEVLQLIANWKKENVASHKINGIRVTNEEAMEIVQSTLIGQVNPKLVYDLNRAGIQAIGLNGFDMNLLSM